MIWEDVRKEDFSSDSSKSGWILSQVMSAAKFWQNVYVLFYFVLFHDLCGNAPFEDKISAERANG